MLRWLEDDLIIALKIGMTYPGRMHLITLNIFFVALDFLKAQTIETTHSRATYTTTKSKTRVLGRASFREFAIVV